MVFSLLFLVISFLVCLFDTPFISENKLGALCFFCLCPIVLFLVAVFFIPTSGSLNREWQKKKCRKADDDSSEWDETKKHIFLNKTLTIAFS